MALAHVGKSLYNFNPLVVESQVLSALERFPGRTWYVDNDIKEATYHLYSVPSNPPGNIPARWVQNVIPV